MAVGAVAVGSGTLAASVIFNTPQTQIDIDYDVSGDVVLNSVVGPTDVGVDIFNSPTITGSVINNGTISATRTGLAVDATNLAGWVRNTGQILVTQGYSEADATGASVTASVNGIDEYAFTSATGESVALNLENSGSVAVDLSGTVVAGNYAYVSVTGTGIDQYGYSGNGNSSGNVVNSGTVDVSVSGEALGVANGYAYASGEAVGIAQDIQSWDGDAVATINNSGAVGVAASADASMGSSGYASADASATGLNQYANTENGDATATITNDGTVDVLATATANMGSFGYVEASAEATGIYQNADTLSGNADASVTNSGSVTAVAKSDATFGSNAQSNSYAYAEATGIDQYAQSDFGNATADIVNSGSVAATASAEMTYGGGGTSYRGYAEADATGIYQQATSYQGDLAVVSLTNSGDISAAANVDNFISQVDSYGYVSADADGVNQSVQAYDGVATASFDNSGSVDVSVNLDQVIGTSGYADAYLDSTGVYQSAAGELGSTAEVTNSGDISSSLTAMSLGGGEVDVYGTAYGVSQFAAATGTSTATPSMLLENTGGVDVSADVSVAATSDAYAEARAIGVRQYSYSSSVDFGVDNSGEIHVDATASAASPGSPTALAYASGVSLAVDSSDVANLDVVNSGVISVFASGFATGGFTSSAAAYGYGLDVMAGGLTGSMENSGDIIVEAHADDDNFGGNAQAIGVRIQADDNQSTFTNTGLIDAYAQSSGNAFATGIYVGTDTRGFHGSTAAGSIVNNGGTIVAVANTGGADFLGNAINAVNATSGQVISLMGEARDGYLLGDIMINSTGSIEVTNGETIFDGVVNRSGPTGAMSIFDGGTFRVGNNADFGPSFVNVTDFSVAADGTLAFALNLGNVPGTDFGQVFATNASLDGTIKGQFQAAYYTAATYTYNSVVNSVNPFGGAGDFAMTTSNTPLMTVTHTNDGDTVNLVATRNSFGSVGGLTSNQQSVADYIDSFYGSAGATSYENLLASFYALDGMEGYQAGLDQLSGAEIAQGLDGQLRSFDQLNTILSRRFSTGAPVEPTPYAPQVTTSAAAAIAGAASDPAAPSYAIWGKGFGSFASFGGDGNGQAYDSTAGGFYLGADGNVASDFTLGLAGGYVADGTDFDNGNSFDFDGFQLAAYGRWDDGTNYARGTVAYGAFSNESSRQVTVGLVTETATGSFDSSAFSVYGEAGTDMAELGDFTLTPFAAFAYTNGSSSAYTETGLTAGNLDVAAASGNSSIGSVGVVVQGDHFVNGMPVTTSARVAYEHEFLDGYAMTSSFAGAPGSPGHLHRGGRRHHRLSDARPGRRRRTCSANKPVARLQWPFLGRLCGELRRAHGAEEVLVPVVG